MVLGPRRFVALFVALSLIAGVLAARTPSVEAASSQAEPPVVEAEVPQTSTPELRQQSSAERVESVAAPEPQFTLPNPEKVVVDLDATALRAGASPISIRRTEDLPRADLPEEVEPPADETESVTTTTTTAPSREEPTVEEPGGTSTSSSSVPPSSTTTTTPLSTVPGPTPQAKGDRVEIEIFDQETVKRVGGEALAFKLAPADGELGSKLGLTIDYSSFRQAFSAGWASSVRLVVLPACALTTPDNPACFKETVLPTRNDLVAGRLEVDSTEIDPLAKVPLAAEPSAEATDDLAPESEALPEPDGPVTGGGSIMLLSASTSGAEGDYAATPLSPSGGLSDSLCKWA